MGRARKKDEASVFILFTLKWTKIKNSNKIKKYINRTFFNTSTNAQISNSNYPKPLSKISPFSQVVNANKNNLTNSESIVSSETNLNISKKADLFDLAIDTD